MARRLRPLPDYAGYAKQLDPKSHDVMDTSKRPNKVVNIDPASPDYGQTRNVFVNSDRNEVREGTRIEEVTRIALDIPALVVKRAVGITFGNRTMKQLERFVPVFTAAGGNADDAADAVICHKILRKLEGLDPSLCRREAEGLKRELAVVFGAGRLPDSEAYIDRLRGGV